MKSSLVLQTVEQIRTSPNLSEAIKRLLETCPVNLKPSKHYKVLQIVCPRCDHVGRLNSFHPTKQKVGTVHYYVAHEKWNRNKMGVWSIRGDKKYRRCYLYNILKKPKYLHKIVNQIFPIGDD